MNCRDLEGESRGEWRLMMTIIAFGYIYFFIYALILCCGGMFICCLMCGGANSANNPVVDKIPYMNAVKSLKKKEFTEVKNKNMD